MSLVLDSSATLANLWEDEITDAVRQVFDVIRDYGAWVPSLWRIEIANALEMDVRRGRRPAEFRDGALADLALLSIQIDQETDRQAWSSTLTIAAKYRLTVYDAAYLELSLRRRLPLATLDRQLRAAAESAGVRLLGM